MGWKQSNDNGVDFKNCNKVQNWYLKVFEVKTLSDENGNVNCVLLNASKSGAKKSDGTYAKGMYITVRCKIGECEIEETDYTNANVLVDGGFSVGEYTAKDGTVKQSYTIFADKVVKA